MADISGIGSGELANFSTDLKTLFETNGTELINWAIGFSALVAVVILIVSGYLFITAAGDPEKIEKAQKGITAAIIGMVIVFLARMIVFFVIDLKDPDSIGGGSPNTPPGVTKGNK